MGIFNSLHPMDLFIVAPKPTDWHKDCNAHRQWEPFRRREDYSNQNLLSEKILAASRSRELSRPKRYKLQGVCNEERYEHYDTFSF